MYANNAYKNYLEDEVLSADPVELIALLYRGAVDAVGSARVCLQQSDIAGRSRKITKASLILTELALSLDHDKGGEFSRSLAELYDYMQRRLIAANVEQSEKPLMEVESLLNTLLEGWQQCGTAQSVNVRSAYALSAPAEYQPLSCTA